MPESTDAPQLTPSQTAAYAKAKEASDRGNHDYAITMLRDIVLAHPTFLEARRLLRANQIAKSRTVSSLARSMSQVKIAPMVISGRNTLKKSPLEALAAAEEILAIDPASSSGNELLADAAEAAGLHETVILAYETLRDAKPDDIENLKKLAKAYLAIGQGEKAAKVYEKVLQIRSNDGEAIKGLKDASAMVASATGGWETGGDFRASLKNADEARKLEQASKVAASEESIHEQIATLYGQLDQSAPNLALVKKIAALYEKAKDLENAISWYEYAFEIANRAEPSIERTIGNLKMQQFEATLTTKEQELAATTDEAARAALQAEVDALRAQKVENVLQAARDRVERYPNDLQLRFELGQALYNAGQYKDAVPELQQALRQPSVRHRAYNYLGLCYAKRNMLDLAAKQFETAAAEMLAMDNTKKEIVYNLGCVLEQAGKKEAALEQFKIIYEVDSKYRDVSDRVEAAYQ
jgi:tetratricopeptide (TPR) repeat protein